MMEAEVKQRVLELQLEKRDVELENHNLLKSLLSTPPIHAGILYTEVGKELNQTLCVLLSGTKRSTLYCNWEDFAFNLGLTSPIIQCIKHNLVQQDPTTYVLLAYVQKENPTIQKILEALFEIKRYDILTQIEPLVKDINKALTSTLETEVFNTMRTLKTPFVLRNLKTKDDRQEFEIQSVTLKILESLMEKNEIIKNVQKYVSIETSTIENKIFNKCEAEHLQKSSIATVTPAIKQQRYDITVFITYTSDASDIVQNLLKTLRTPINGFRIGVLALSEHFPKVSQSPEQFIFDCFAQVDYVFPIITKNYLLEVTGKNKKPISSTIENYDHKYVKYIFNLIITHYVRNSCRNKMVCSIIPDDIIHEILRHAQMGHPSLQTWIRISEIDLLIKGILKQRNKLTQK